MSFKRHRKHKMGGALVTIPVADYAELLECRRLSAERTISHDQFSRPSRSTIARDTEVAVFLTQRYGIMPMDRLLRECRRRFGGARRPSRTAAYAHWKKVRRDTAKMH